MTTELVRFTQWAGIQPMANDPNWEPDGVTHPVRFCEGGGTYRKGFPPLLSYCNIPAMMR